MDFIKSVLDMLLMASLFVVGGIILLALLRLFCLLISIEVASKFMHWRII